MRTWTARTTTVAGTYEVLDVAYDPTPARSRAGALSQSRLASIA